MSGIYFSKVELLLLGNKQSYWVNFNCCLQVRRWTLTPAEFFNFFHTVGKLNLELELQVQWWTVESFWRVRELLQFHEEWCFDLFLRWKDPEYFPPSQKQLTLKEETNLTTTCNTQKHHGRQFYRRSCGILIGAYTCGLIQFFTQLYGSESLSQVCIPTLFKDQELFAMTKTLVNVIL